jgi:hypothetical protein
MKSSGKGERAGALLCGFYLMLVKERRRDRPVSPGLPLVDHHGLLFSTASWDAVANIVLCRARLDSPSNRHVPQKGSDSGVGIAPLDLDGLPGLQQMAHVVEAMA